MGAELEELGAIGRRLALPERMPDGWDAPDDWAPPAFDELTGQRYDSAAAAAILVEAVEFSRTASS